MASRVLLAYVAADALFVIMGAIMLGFSVIVQNMISQTPTNGEQAAINLLYSQFPLTAGIANGALYFVTFLATIPGIIMPTRGWLKLGGYMVVATSLFSLVIGLKMWILTLDTKESFAALWNDQPSEIQGLMQTAFQCCGYFNSTGPPAFITDSTCPSPAAAALMRGCATPIASFGNVFVDDIFTAIFGMCGIGGLLILATACLLKDRKERERFRYIDVKNGAVSAF